MLPTGAGLAFLQHPVSKQGPNILPTRPAQNRYLPTPRFCLTGYGAPACLAPHHDVPHSLDSLYQKNLRKALELVEEGGVVCFKGEATGRTIFHVSVAGAGMSWGRLWNPRRWDLMDPPNVWDESGGLRMLWP